MLAEAERLSQAGGLAFELIACDPALADTAQFCEAYGYALADSANTILVVGKSEPRIYAACLVLADSRLDVNGEVRRRLGTRKASFASAEETEALTGMALGGVTVVGVPAEIPVWIDARVMERTSIVLGGGGRDRKLVVPPAWLLGRPQATPGATVEVVDGLAKFSPDSTFCL